MAAVQGLNPSVLVAPDYQTQMMEAQRRLDLANALRAQALQDTPGNGGKVSWTQGLSRIAAALSASANSRQALSDMKGANQAYAAGMARMFGGQPQQSAPQPQAAPVIHQSGPVTPGDEPVAPPQAAPQPPPTSPPQAGGAHGAFNLTGDPQTDMAMYVMNPDEYGKAVIGSHTPTDFARLLEQSGVDPASPLGRQLMQSQVAKQNYVAPVNGRPGSTIRDPYDPSKVIGYDAPNQPGAFPIYGPDGMPKGYQQAPGAAQAAGTMAGAQAGAKAAAEAPFDVQQVFNPQTGQMELVPKSAITGGGGSLNSYYGRGQQQGAHFAAGPSLGAQAAADAYGKGSAAAFLNTQNMAEASPQRVQALREMSSLITGPNALATGPTAAKFQQIAEEHGLPFGYSGNAFIFNKDAARFVAQNAADLGLNGSDARLGMMANASPNMKMTPDALKVVIPTMIGLEYAKMAKATAASAWAQRSPGTNAQFESQWRQAYDPRMFTAYAEGGPQALAKAPANLRQQWLKDYRTLKGMGVDFTQFAQ